LTADIRDEIADIPAVTQDLQNGAADVPDDVQDVRDEFRDVPNAVTDIRNGVLDVPDGVADVADALRNMRNAVMDIQLVSANILNEMPDVRNAVWNIRNVVQDIPNRICKLQNDTGRKPGQPVIVSFAAPVLRNPQADLPRLNRLLSDIAALPQRSQGKTTEDQKDMQ
jgi:hypothetical protein